MEKYRTIPPLLLCYFTSILFTCALPDQGSKFHHTDITLNPGWNLITLEGEFSMEFMEEKLSESILDILWTWSGKQFEKVNQFRPNQPYWVYSIKDLPVTISFIYEMEDQENSPPFVRNDVSRVNPGQEILVDVLANDEDPDNDPLTIIQLQAPKSGTASIIGPNIAYIADAAFIGSDTVSFLVSDGKGNATKSLLIIDVNGDTTPKVLDDFDETKKNIPVQIQILRNDGDADGDSLQVMNVSDPQHGTAIYDGNGVIVYSPEFNWGGTDHFTYTVRDDDDYTLTAKVTVVVHAPPVAFDDNGVTQEDTPLRMYLLENDTDQNDDLITVNNISDLNHGTIENHGDGSITFFPESRFTGELTFTYEVIDSAGLTDNATVTIFVNSIPHAINDRARTTQNTPVTIHVLENDEDEENTSFLVTHVTQAQSGELAIINQNTAIRYTPEPDFVGRVNFTYTMSDNLGASSIGEVILDVIENHPPQAIEDFASGYKNEPEVMDVLLNDFDLDEHEFTIIDTTDGENGTVEINPDGTLTYTPNTDWTGRDTITYTLEDEAGGTSTTEVTVIISSVEALSITNVVHTYSDPYLLDFDFSLVDQDMNAVVIDPGSIVLTAMEEKNPVSATETAVHILKGQDKQLRCNLVFDYTNSMASTLTNGDQDMDGRSDAVEAMETAAKARIIDRFLPNAQIGLFEFHREDKDPIKVSDFTSNGDVLKNKIDSIWTEHVQQFPAASRCWDAVYAAIQEFTPEHKSDQDRFVIFLSDGRDESSSRTPDDIINLATKKDKDVKVYCIGFGAELHPKQLQRIARGTKGEYFQADDSKELFLRFQQIADNLLGQYTVRWATLKRLPESPKTFRPFTPSFEIMVDGLSASFTGTPYPLDQFVGDVLIGKLRLVADPITEKTTKVVLRSVYTPRFIRRIRFFIESSNSFQISLVKPDEGGILPGQWQMREESEDPAANGKWITIESPDTENLNTSLRYAAPGPIVQFQFTEVESTDCLFSSFEFDNSIYSATGGQSLTLLQSEIANCDLQ